MSMIGVDRVNACRGVLFDLDGVLTPTADIHRDAWKKLFNAVFSTQFPDAKPVTDADYYALIDGRARLDAVAQVLASRGITMPWGAESDSSDTLTVIGLGSAKDGFFLQEIRESGVRPYQGSVRLVQFLADRGVPMGVVSASRNAREVLTAANLIGYFPVVVDGVVAGKMGLPGKPSPASYREAARRLGVEPGVTAVIEDAVSGVAAGRAGRFGLVMGVDRGAGRDALIAAGADQVVNDLGDLVGDFEPWDKAFSAQMGDSNAEMGCAQ